MKIPPTTTVFKEKDLIGIDTDFVKKKIIIVISKV